MFFLLYDWVRKKYKVTKIHTTEPRPEYLSRQREIKMLIRRGKKIGGLDGLDMVYRWAFSVIIKALLKNGSRESFRIFHIIYSGP